MHAVTSSSVSFCSVRSGTGYQRVANDINQTLSSLSAITASRCPPSGSSRHGSRSGPRSGGPPKLGPIDNNDAFADDLAVKVRPKTKKPPMYRVLLLNDDFTPMEFVTYVLERVFNRSRQDATDIMLAVHHSGIGTAGVYTYEIAETKVDQVMMLARQHEHPLQCTMEREN
jgi:ATP-dependent Clp protease adaptor protein ClpS